MEAEASTQDEGHLFTIKSKRGNFEVNGRADAIAKAKEVSQNTWRPVHVEREDHRVKMRFRRGDLQTYRYETRRRRRKKKS